MSSNYARNWPNCSHKNWTMVHTKQVFSAMQRKGAYHGMVCIINVWHLGGLKNFLLADMHIHDINTVLWEEEDFEDHHEPPLINFEKWIHLKDQVLDAMHYHDILLKYSEDGLKAAMGYLKQQLQGITVGMGWTDWIPQKSVQGWDGCSVYNMAALPTPSSNPSDPLSQVLLTHMVTPTSSQLNWNVKKPNLGLIKQVTKLLQSAQM